MWTVHEYDEKYLDQIIEMTKDNYGDVHIADREYLKWQYRDNPAGEAIINIGLNDTKDKVIGQYVIIPAIYKMFNKVDRGTISLNTLTHASYRGKGVFTGLAKAAFRECETKYAFTIGFPNQNSYHGFVTKLDFNTLENVPLLITPITLSILVQKKTNKILGTISKLFEPIFNKSIRQVITKKESYVEEVTYDNVHEMDGFWNQVQQKYNIMATRGSEFIKWRYLDAPCRDYKVYVLKDKHSILGYIVGGIQEVSGIKCGMVVDFLVKPDTDIQKINMLIDTVMNHFIKEKCEMAGALMYKHTEEYKLLRKKHFYKCPKCIEPQPFIPVIRTYNKDSNALNEEINKSQNWFLTMGDYDAV